MKATDVGPWCLVLRARSVRGPWAVRGPWSVLGPWSVVPVQQDCASPAAVLGSPPRDGEVAVETEIFSGSALGQQNNLICVT